VFQGEDDNRRITDRDGLEKSGRPRGRGIGGGKGRGKKVLFSKGVRGGKKEEERHPERWRCDTRDLARNVHNFKQGEGCWRFRRGGGFSKRGGEKSSEERARGKERPENNWLRAPPLLTGGSRLIKRRGDMDGARGKGPIGSGEETESWERL